MKYNTTVYTVAGLGTLVDGLCAIKKYVLLPMLRNMGVSEKQINKVMRDNPLQLMTKL